MMKITSISQQKNDPSRVSIFVNEKFFAGLSNVSFSKLDLHQDDILSEEKIKLIEIQSELDGAIDFVIKSCVRARQTTQTIHEKLIKKDYAEPVILQAIAKGKELNLIDDSEFIRLFIKDKTNLKNWGAKRIKAELVKKGIPGEQIDEELEKSTEVQPDLDEVKRLVKKKFSPLTNQDNHQKAVKFLQYRGFSWDEIKSLLSQVEEED